MPAVSTVERPRYEETSIDRVAQDDTAVLIPEFHRIQEHARRIVTIYLMPALAAVRGLEDDSRTGNGHDNGRTCVKGFDIPEVLFFIPGNNDPLPGLSSVAGSAY